jgi:outer membrane immunogenic protein
MNRFLLSALAILAMTGAASAADLPLKAAAAAPLRPTCAAAQWQGAYFGIAGGSIYHNASRIDSDGFLTDNSGYELNKWGGMVGGEAGYNVANCNTFWGVEVDGSWTSVRNTFHDNPNSGAPTTIRTRVDTLLTGRLRTGVALDNLMFFVSGGLAGAHIRTTWTDEPDSVEFKEWRLGWTAGVGTEVALSRNLSFKSEFMYVGFTDRDLSTVFTTFGPASFRHNDSLWVSRVGLNYRW